jgi:hypothetical protein
VNFCWAFSRPTTAATTRRHPRRKRRLQNKKFIKGNSMKAIITLLFLVAVGNIGADAATINWTNTAGGNWSVAANWSPNQVPGSSDDSVVASNGIYTVTLDTSPNIHSLMLGGTSGTQTLATAGNTLTLNNASVVNANGILSLNGGTLSGVGLFTINGQLNWTNAGFIAAGSTLMVGTNGVVVLAAGNSGYGYLRGELTNAGTVKLVSGALEMQASQLVNLPGGLVDIQANDPSGAVIDGDNTTLIVNGGTLRKSAGTGTSTIYPVLDNTPSGVVDAQTGTIIVGRGDTTNSTGIYQSESGGTLNFNSSFTAYSGVQFNGLGTNVITGGTFTFNGLVTISNLLAAGGSLAGTNGVIAGTLKCANSTFFIPGSTSTIATNGTLLMAAGSGYVYLRGVLTNAGTINLASGTLLMQAGQLVNLPGALVNIQANDPGGAVIDGGNTELIINAGMVRKSAGTGTSTINPIFNNTGTLDTQTGTISLAGSYSLTNGTLNFGISSLASFGKINLSGSPATLAGSVSANLNNGYVPATGNSFSVLTYGSRTGTFMNFNLPYAVAWQTNYGSTTFTLSVLNVRPLPVPIADQTVDELTLFTVTNRATDPDLGQTVTSALVSAPSGMTINQGIISWIPAQTQSPSTNTILVSVTDNGTPPLSATNSFTVIVREVNIAPVLPAVSTQTVYEMNLLTVTNTASNFNIHATNIGYGLVNPPAGMNINSSGIITWTPDQTQPGTYTITTVVTNLDVFDMVNPSLTATNSFTVMVYEVNLAPSVFSPGSQTVNELTLMTVTVFYTEASHHSVITGWGLQTVPTAAGASIDNNGIITWTPAQNQSPGSYTFTVVATNSNPYDPVNPHLTGSASFTVTVQEVNVAPSLPIISTQIVNELTLLTVTNTATNANIHASITGYALVNPPSNMVINASGIITWTPSHDQSPSTNIVTTVVTNMDSFDNVNPQLTATNSFTVIVSGTNVAPYYIRRVGQTLTTDIPGANVTGGPSYWQISLPYPSMRTSGNQVFIARPDSKTEANGVGAASSPALQWFTTIPVSTLPGLNSPPTSIVSGSSDFIWTNGVIDGATSQFVPIEIIDATLFIQGVTQGSGAITFSWNAITGQTYQVQSNTNLTQNIWIDFGNVLTGADATLSFTNSIGSDPQRFYRVKWLP